MLRWRLIHEVDSFVFMYFHDSASCKMLGSMTQMLVRVQFRRASLAPNLSSRVDRQPGGSHVLAGQPITRDSRHTIFTWS